MSDTVEQTMRYRRQDQYDIANQARREYSSGLRSFVSAQKQITEALLVAAEIPWGREG